MDGEPHLTGAVIAFRLGLVFLLVAANGFFVAAEFALVGSRRTQIETLARGGNRRARIAQNAMEHLDHYISATQLGITLASLALGWVGETTVAALIITMFDGLSAPWNVIATHVVAGTIAFIFISFLHIVLGELAPKSVALLFPESTSMWLAAPLVAFSKLFSPFIIVLNGTANGLLKLIGLRRPQEFERVHRPEEIALLVQQMQKHKQIASEPGHMISAALTLGDRVVADVMTHRVNIIALPESATVEQASEVMLLHDLSRVPVYREDVDQVTGLVLAHDVWRASRSEEATTLVELVRPVAFVPDTKPVEDLIGEMQRDASHLAVVVDEFGGTAGLVTLEDLLEEIVGEIRDETEIEIPAIQAREDGITDVSGTASIFAVNEHFNVSLDTSQYATMGGLMMGALGRVAQVGDEVKMNGLLMTVSAMSGRRISVVTMRRAD